MKILFFFTLFILSGNAMAKDQRMSPEVFFNKASFENMETVCSEFYHPDVVFEDPLGTVKGLPGLVGYYKNLYENLIEIRFEPLNTFKKGDEEIFVWQMHMRHKKVGNGKLIVLEGVSLFRYQDDKVIYHRDYFDAGAMIYEKVPVLGNLIRWIKRRAHGDH